MAESDYASHLFQYIQNARSSRSKRHVVFSEEMEYTKGKSKIYLTPARYGLTNDKYPVASDALSDARERLLWGDNPDYEAHKREFAKYGAEKAAYDDMQKAKAAVIASREQSVLQLKVAQEEYHRHMTELYDTAMSGEMDPVERAKLWLQRNQFQKEYDPLSKQTDIKTAESVQHNPVFHLLTPAEVHIGTKPPPKKKPESESSPKTEPVIYAETPNPVPVPALLIPKPSKESAKRQWVKDVLSSTGFTFKTPEECSTKRRLAQHYMSKDDILRVLEQHPDVIADLPPSYLTATKEGLCEMLFKPS